MAINPRTIIDPVEGSGTMTGPGPPGVPGVDPGGVSVPGGLLVVPPGVVVGGLLAMMMGGNDCDKVEPGMMGICGGVVATRGGGVSSGVKPGTL